MTLTFVDTLPESVTTGKKGRPSLFTPEIRDALTANPGVYAQIQEKVKGRSRVTTLRNEWKAEGFEFQSRTTATETHTKADGTEVKTDVVTIYARKVVAAPEVADSVAEIGPEAEVPAPEAAPAAKGRKTPAKPKA